MSRPHVTTHQAHIADRTSPVAPAIVMVGAVVASLAWSYWPILTDLFREWQVNQDYSVGQLVPLAALYLLWLDRVRLRRSPVATCWWGIALIVLGQAANAYGLMYLFESAGRYSIVVTITGLVLLIAGWQVFWNVKWILLFLFLMVPLPGRIHNAISGPLQSQATVGAVFFLELFGVTVARDGHVILLNDSVPLAVAEACSGLRMLTAFVVVGSVLAYAVERPRWQKLTLVLSTVPVAIACNLVRLVVTAFLYMHINSKTAERFFHDFAGLTMMPMAIALLLGELWILGKLTVPEKSSQSISGP